MKPLVGRAAAESVFVSEVKDTPVEETTMGGVVKRTSVERAPADTSIKEQPGSPIISKTTPPVMVTPEPAQIQQPETTQAQKTIPTSSKQNSETTQEGEKVSTSVLQKLETSQILSTSMPAVKSSKVNEPAGAGQVDGKAATKSVPTSTSQEPVRKNTEISSPTLVTPTLSIVEPTSITSIRAVSPTSEESAKQTTKQATSVTIPSSPVPKTGVSTDSVEPAPKLPGGNTTVSSTFRSQVLEAGMATSRLPETATQVTPSATQVRITQNLHCQNIG